MTKRKLGQLYIDYTENVSNVGRIEIKVSGQVDEGEDGDEEPVVNPGLPDPDMPDDPEAPNDPNAPDDGVPDNPLLPPLDPSEPPEDHDVLERRYHQAMDSGNHDVARNAMLSMMLHWQKAYAKDFQRGIFESVVGPLEETVAESVVMHEYAKLSNAAYVHFYHGHEMASTYLKDPAHEYVQGFGDWQIDRDLSTPDNLVLFKGGEHGVTDVTVAYRGTSHKPVLEHLGKAEVNTGVNNAAHNVGDWQTNMKMMFERGETTKRMEDADNQFVRVMSKYGREKITVTGHSQGGGVSAYIGEKYNVAGHHYQPAMFFDARRRILGVKEPPRVVGGTQYSLRPVDRAVADAPYEDMEEVAFDDTRPLLERQGPRMEEVALTDSRRSIYGERNATWMHHEVNFKNSMIHEQKAVQNIYRTRGDVVSSVTLSGVDKNPNWKVNVINSTVENHESLASIHSHSNFDPPPADGAALERSGLLAGEERAGMVLVNRATTQAAVRGIAKSVAAVGAGVGVGFAVKDTYDRFKTMMDNPNMTKTDRGVVGSIEIAKQGASFALADIAGGAAGASVGAALAGMAPAIVASGGTLLVGLAVGAAVAVGVTMLGNYAEKHYKDIEKGFETVGKGVVTAGKTVEKGLESAGKAVGKGIASGAKTVGKSFKKGWKKFKHLF